MKSEDCIKILSEKIDMKLYMDLIQLNMCTEK